MKTEEQRELLFDLKHDLAKYLRMPLIALPEHPSEAQLRSALKRSLQETLRSPRGIRSATEIWRTFVSEAEAVELNQCQGWHALVDSVTRSLAWEKALNGTDAISLDSVHSDFDSVRDAINKLITELDNNHARE